MGGSSRRKVGITEKNVGPYWDLVNAGWRAAAARLDLDLIIEAPPFEDIDEQRRLMRRQLDDGVDALAFVASRTDGFDDIVSEARSRGVPVITFDLDAPRSGRSFFVGMETPFDCGRRLAEHMIADGVTSGTVYLQNGSAHAAGAQGKREGLIDTLTAAGLDVRESPPDGEDESRARETAADLIPRIPDLTAAVGVYGYHPSVLADVRGRQPFRVYGFDLLTPTIELIESGRVRGSVWIREVDFGVHAAAAVSDILRLGELTALEVRGLDPVRWADNVRVPPPTFVTSKNLHVARERYRSVLDLSVA